MPDDRFETYARSLTSPASDAFAVVLDEDRVARALYIGSGGDVSVVTVEGSTVTFVGLTGSMVLPVSISRVNASGTTATNILGLV